MSLSEKANQIKELVSLIVSVLPKIVDLIFEVVQAIREVRVNG